jgi:hypothetical protein
VIRYALSRRWLTWHLLWAVSVVVCLRLAIWQWEVAGAPHVPGAPVQSWRNYAYAVNWVIFAVVGAWFWWRFMRDQRAAELASSEVRDPSEPVEAEESGRASTPAAPQRQSVPPVSVRDPVTGGRVRFDPFADAAEPAEGGRDDPPTGR